MQAGRPPVADQPLAQSRSLQPQALQPQAVQPQAATAPSGYSVTGIDVSGWQGNVDWSAVAKAGVKYAYVKATEGTTYINPYFNQQYGGAKAAGLYAGAYVFARPDQSPVPQADYFMAHAQLTNDGKTLPLMLDLEWPPDSYDMPNGCWGLSPTQMVTWIHAFVNEVRAKSGKPMVIYTSSSWWNPCTGNSKAFSDQWLNVADWSGGSPSLPTGWGSWTFWQYADGGSVPGDQEVFSGSLSQLAQLAKPTTGYGASQPSVVTPGSGNSQVFYKGFDQRLWTASGNGGSWSTPVSIGMGALGGNPVAVVQQAGNADVFWRGGDGGLWHAWYANGKWNGPISHAGHLTDDPAVVTTGTGAIDIFWRGTDSRLWTAQYLPDQGWLPNKMLPAGQICSQPGAVEHPDGSVEVFWRGCDNGLWTIARSGTSSWAHIPTGLGGKVAGIPAPVISASYTTDVFYRAADGSLSHSWRQSSTWHGPQSLGMGPLGGDPVAVGQSNGLIDVFWRGQDHALWHGWYNRGWHGPQSFHGKVGTKPAAIVKGGPIDVFYNDGVRSLGLQWFDTDWHGPASAGGFLE
jgi:GH25 family lysozyme M1 (1,4-beta-N-acetylmuramidase)